MNTGDKYYRSILCDGVCGFGFKSQEEFEEEVRETVTELQQIGNGTRTLKLNEETDERVT